MSFTPKRRLATLLIILLVVTAIGALLAPDRSDAAPEKGLAPAAYMAIVGVPSEPPDTIKIETYVTGFNTDTVTFITHAGDERLFVGEKHGVIRIVDPQGNLLPTPFLDIKSQVRTSNWEEGLLGLAFHPDYYNNGLFFVTYTWDDPSGLQGASDGQIRLVRYKAIGDPVTANLADPGSATVLLRIPKPPEDGFIPSPVHNGGDVHFGPDGYLYVGTGDGGPDPTQGIDPEPGDPYNNSQRLDTLLGKIIRIDVDNSSPHQPDCGNPLPRTPAPYAIPDDNPWRDGAAQPTQCDEIWAVGLRNPWRFSFDRLTGDMYIGDVGEWKREEVNFHAAGAPGGANYGWHCFEGTFDWRGTPETVGDCTLGGFVPPFFEYAHNQGISVIGGYVYRGDRFPALRGQYLFGDFFSGRMWRSSRPAGQWQTTPLTVQLPSNDTYWWSTFGEDVHGELYLGRFAQPSAIYRVTIP